MSRVILHSDANSFYASVEICYRPELRDKPVAVCGDPEARHGIVLTKNPIAKKYGIQTGMAIWQAQQCCPQLVMIYLLSESVGVRMRESGMRAQTVSIGVRTTDLRWFSCQRKIARPTCLTRDIATTAMALVSERYAWCLPFRSIGISCGTLTPNDAPEQLDIYEDYLKREKAE